MVLDVGDVHDGLGGEEEELADRGELFSGQVHRTDRLPFVQGGLDLLQDEDELQRFLVAPGARLLRVAVQRLFHGLEVGERELGVDDVDVVDRIDAARDVDDVVVVEAAHDVGDGVALADVREELVAEAFALARAGDEARDVDEFDGGGHDAFGLDDFGEGLQARIGHFNDAHVRLDGAEGIVLRRDAGLRQRVEDGRLAHVGKPDDATFQTHDSSRSIRLDEAVRLRGAPPVGNSVAQIVGESVGAAGPSGT